MRIKTSNKLTILKKKKKKKKNRKKENREGREEKEDACTWNGTVGKMHIDDMTRHDVLKRRKYGKKEEHET